jgi:transposase
MRSTPRPWRTCCGPTCWPRHGSPHRTPARPAAWSAPAPAWSACAHASNPSFTRCSPDLGIIPELSTLFGPAGRRWLAELQLPTGARSRLDAGLRLIDAVTVEVRRADADLRTGFARDARVRRLLPIPGIGLVTAATVVAEVWDIQRFPSPERLCSWAGLTPGERTSDAHTRRGHITKQGSRWLRWTLVEAATSAVRDPQLGRFTTQIAQRRGPKIARVALARRLLTLCYYALRDHGGCRAYPAPTS